MGIFKGHDPNARLDDLLHSVIDYTDHAQNTEDGAGEGAGNNHANQESSNMSKQRKSSFGGAAVTTIVSLVALLFSGFSFYETVLKQPKITIYKPQLIHMYRKGYRDILAFPITISNDGAKRGTVLSFNLIVTNPATNESKEFKNLYFGNNPADTSRIFTPLTVAGRSSLTDVVMFEATKAGAFFKTTGGVQLDLNFKLTLNMEKAEFWFPPKTDQGLSFTMSTKYIQSFPQMEKGRPTVLRLQ